MWKTSRNTQKEESIEFCIKTFVFFFAKNRLMKISQTQDFELINGLSKNLKNLDNKILHSSVNSVLITCKVN